MRIKEITNGAASAMLWHPVTGNVLTILRSDASTMPLTWCLPGGHVEPGEDHEQAVIRECWEEIGHDVSSYPRSLLCRRVTQEPRFVHHDYVIMVPEKFKPRLNEEHVDHVWSALSELPQPQAWPLQMLLSNDQAAERLKNFQEQQRRRV